MITYFAWNESPQELDIMAKWAAQRVWPGKDKNFGPCACMGVIDGTTLVAVMVYHNYEPEHGVLEISGAADDKRWLTRPVLHDMFKFPFDDIGCQMVVMRIETDNKILARMLKAYGFDWLRIPRLRGRNEDEYLFTLTDDDWRSNAFESRNHGQKIAA